MVARSVLAVGGVGGGAAGLDFPIADDGVSPAEKAGTKRNPPESIFTILNHSIPSVVTNGRSRRGPSEPGI
jgi:hypothetical protein